MTSPAPLRVLALCLLLGSSALAQPRFGGRLALALGGDSNPLREYGTTPRALEPTATLLASLQGRLPLFGAATLAGTYDAGARGFAFNAQASTLGQALTLELGNPWSERLGGGLFGTAKDRRGGGRAYTDLAGGPFAELRLAPMELRLRGGGHRFLYPAFLSESFTALEAGALARIRLGSHQSLQLGAEAGRRFYGVGARTETEALDERRTDLAWAASAGYAYRGPFALGFGYAVSGVASNSFGESRVRHRLTANAGLRLFWELTLLAQAALQLEQYPDGVFLSPEVSLLEDDENASALSLRLARPLSSSVDLELGVSAYGARFAQSDLLYLRQVATVGLSLRL